MHYFQLTTLYSLNPAACHVVPEVNLSLSSRITSSTPSLERWYATDAPMIPPPTITTFALSGRLLLRFSSKIVGVVEKWWGREYTYRFDSVCGCCFDATEATGTCRLCLFHRINGKRLGTAVKRAMMFAAILCVLQ